MSGTSICSLICDLNAFQQKFQMLEIAPPITHIRLSFCWEIGCANVQAFHKKDDRWGNCCLQNRLFTLVQVTLYIWLTWKVFSCKSWQVQYSRSCYYKFWMVLVLWNEIEVWVRFPFLKSRTPFNDFDSLHKWRVKLYSELIHTR